jgi:hypothetical protein
MRGAAKIDDERAAGRRKARLSLCIIDQPPLPDHGAGTNSRTILTINNINTCGKEKTR